MTHPLPWGADHFKSRWCLKCVIRGKKQNSRERRREGKRQRARGHGPANNRGAVGLRTARGPRASEQPGAVPGAPSSAEPPRFGEGADPRALQHKPV